MSNRKRETPMKWYRVRLAMPVMRGEYLVRAGGYDEAARKAIAADTITNPEHPEDTAAPAGVESIAEYGDVGAVLL